MSDSSTRNVLPIRCFFAVTTLVKMMASGMQDDYKLVVTEVTHIVDLYDHFTYTVFPTPYVLHLYRSSTEQHVTMATQKLSAAIL